LEASEVDIFILKNNNNTKEVGAISLVKRKLLEGDLIQTDFLS
jgi:hypothetical protein